VNIAAHELRTPIQPIMGSADILRSKETDTGECVETVNRFTAAGIYMPYESHMAYSRILFIRLLQLTYHFFNSHSDLCAFSDIILS
jgi:hypothetical protein